MTGGLEEPWGQAGDLHDTGTTTGKGNVLGPGSESSEFGHQTADPGDKRAGLPGLLASLRATAAPLASTPPQLTRPRPPIVYTLNLTLSKPKTKNEKSPNAFVLSFLLSITNKSSGSNTISFPVDRAPNIL